MNRVLKPFIQRVRFNTFHNSESVLPPVGSMWRHYKGGYYRIEGYTVREFDGRLQVVYSDYYHPRQFPWNRPFAEWAEKVEAGGVKLKRFSYIAPV